MVKKILSVLIMLGFLPIGCYWQSAQVNRYPDIINTWYGHNIDDLMDSWGYPQLSYTSKNGNKVYVYSRETVYIPPIWTTPILNCTISGGKTSTRFCNTYFETNDDKTIVNGGYEGNACN